MWGGYLCTVGLRVIEMPDLFGVQAALEYELFFVGGMVYASWKMIGLPN